MYYILHQSIVLYIFILSYKPIIYYTYAYSRAVNVSVTYYHT